MAKPKKKKKLERSATPWVDSRVLGYLAALAVALFFLLSFYIRGVIPADAVFRAGITGFASDDAVFHMRLVENTIANFPHRLTYDAFTMYPYGYFLHWGPMFDQLIAFFSLLVGLGSPGQETVNTVGAYFPAVMGALVVIPVYVLGRELADRKTGVLAALLAAILPGDYLSRTILGFTDNHVWEIFFTTLMMMFFVLAIKRGGHLSFKLWLERDWHALRAPLVYSFFAGVAFGGYLLGWTSGVLFGVIFGIFLVLQYIIDHLEGRSTEYLGVIGGVAYLVAMVMVLPFVQGNYTFDSGHYSLLHLVVTGGGALVFILLGIVSRKFRGMPGYYYPVFVAGFIVLTLLLIKILAPGLYGASVGQWQFIFEGRSGGGLTIAEAQKFPPGVGLSYFGFNYYLTMPFFVADTSDPNNPNPWHSVTSSPWLILFIPCYALLAYYIYRQRRPEHLLLFVWSVFILVIALAQRRFTYYYAVNVALLSSFLGGRILDFFGWQELKGRLEYPRVLRMSLSLGLVLLLLVFYPSGGEYLPWSLAMKYTRGGPIGYGYYEWNEALTWMRYNTPDPGLDYLGVYQRPPPGEPYPYPPEAYGVMSWWDYGHIITYWGHRIPNANPFQAGIGGGPNHAPGASTFLTAPDEETADRVLANLSARPGEYGARYIATNAYMAYAIVDVFFKWNDLSDEEIARKYYTPVQTNRGIQMVPSQDYYRLMVSRLHIFDASGLKHYRLVHESPPNPFTKGGRWEQGHRMIYNQLYGGSLSEEPTGYAKIFERVKGARLQGTAEPGEKVTVTARIRTNQGREFTYTQTTTSRNGSFELVVPYSTEGPLPGQTNFDTAPTGPYTLTIGNRTLEVRVSEEDVLEGRVVEVG